MAKDLKPFRRYNFFLDLKNCPQLLNSLTDIINQLGGTIESFLSKNVKYVVTNRPRGEWPQKTLSSYQLQSPTPSIVMNANGASFSRGKMLLAKSAQAQPKTTDTLELARNWNLKIISATEMMEFCKKHLNNFQEDIAKPIEQNRRVLAPPYIKVVDNSFKYKTNFKELAEWPEINFDYQPELCPFFKRRVLPQNNANISQQSNKSTTLNHAKQFNDKCTVLTTPILTPTLNFTKSIPTTTRTASKRKHMIFCEICHKDYDDFEEHLNTETHANFLNNDENFGELLSVITSLPPFLKKPVKTFKIKNRFSDNNTSNNNNSNKNNRSNDGTSNGLFTSHHIMPLAEISNRDNNNINNNLATKDLGKYKKTPSPPSMMRSIHSINTWGSGSKSRSFVALHDLINKNNEESNNNQQSAATYVATIPENEFNNFTCYQDDDVENKQIC